MTAHPWPQLQTLHITNNSEDLRAYTFPAGVRNMKQLRCLELHEATDMPEWLGELQQLEDLNLSYATFESLSPAITRLQSLTRLDLSYSRLTTLPDDLFQLTGLVELLLEDTSCTRLPPALDELTRLTRLSVNGNRALTVCAQV